ncbi:hypothetical protein ACFO4E_10730 [Nocardiopsis mangrovi]|uniref:HTH luxR-type domain-containing protein n=1 Tax=Nocardiopsis mangrovi TaxID=1179818 RepID=A0ABV9DTV5_9ACTN
MARAAEARGEADEARATSVRLRDAAADAREEAERTRAEAQRLGAAADAAEERVRDAAAAAEQAHAAKLERQRAHEQADQAASEAAERADELETPADAAEAEADRLQEIADDADALRAEADGAHAAAAQRAAELEDILGTAADAQRLGSEVEQARADAADLARRAEAIDGEVQGLRLELSRLRTQPQGDRSAQNTPEHGARIAGLEADIAEGDTQAARLRDQAATRSGAAEEAGLRAAELWERSGIGPDDLDRLRNEYDTAFDHATELLRAADSAREAAARAQDDADAAWETADGVREAADAALRAVETADEAAVEAQDRLHEAEQAVAGAETARAEAQTAARAAMVVSDDAGYFADAAEQAARAAEEGAETARQEALAAARVADDLARDVFPATGRLGWMLQSTWFGTHPVDTTGLLLELEGRVDAITDPRVTPQMRAGILSQVRAQAARDIRPFSRERQAEQDESGFTFAVQGPGGEWTARLHVDPDAEFRRVPAASEMPPPARRARPRLMQGAGDPAYAYSFGGGHGGSKSFSLGILVTPFYIAPIGPGVPELDMADARLTARGGIGYRVRTSTLTASGSSGDYAYTELAGPPEPYDADLPVTLTLTPPPVTTGQAPATATSGPAPAPDPLDATPPTQAQDGARTVEGAHEQDAGLTQSWRLAVRLFVPGGPGTNPPDAPERITLADPRAADAAGVPGPGARAIDRGFPVYAGDISSTAPEGGMSLADWARDRLLGYSSAAVKDRPSPSPDASGRNRLVKQPPKPSAAFTRHNATTLQGLRTRSLVRHHLGIMSTGHADLPFVDADGQDRRLVLTSSPTSYRLLPSPPKTAEFSTITRVETSVAQTTGKRSWWSLLFGGGADLRISDRTFRFAPAVVEYAFRQTMRQVQDTRQDDSGRYPLMWGSTDTVLYEVTRTYYARFSGDPAPTKFTGTTIELFTLEDARLLHTADTSATETGTVARPDDPSAPVEPPFPHLRGPHPKNFHPAVPRAFTFPDGSPFFTGGPATDSASTHDAEGARDGETDGAAPVPARGTPLTEWLGDRFVYGLARRFPGLVVADLSRTESDFSHRPGGPTSLVGREHRPLRRDYATALENTHRVRTALQQANLKGNLDKLRHDGIPVDLRETASVDAKDLFRSGKKFIRPGLVTVRLFADVGALNYSGTSERMTGVFMIGGSQRGSSHGSGNSHTLAARFVGTYAGEGAPDASGAPTGGAFQQQLRAALARESATGQGISTGFGTDAWLLFTGATDTWSSDVTFYAMIDDSQRYHGSDVLRDRGDLLVEGIQARMEVSTPRLARPFPTDVTPLTVDGGHDTDARLRSESDPGSTTDDVPGVGYERLTSEQARAIITGRGITPPVPAGEDGDTATGDAGSGAIARVNGRSLNHLLDGTVFIASVNTGGETPARTGAGGQVLPAQPSLLDLTRRMFSAEFVDARYFGLRDGYTRKYDHFTGDSEAGRRFFENVLSQENLAAHLINGIVSRPEFDGGVLSPHTIRPTVVTESVVESLTAVPVDLRMYFEGTDKSALTHSRTRTLQASLGGVHLPVGNTNPPDADPASTRGDAAAPTFYTGPSAGRNWIISSHSTATVHDYSIRTTHIRTPFSYLIQGSGLIRQSAEIARELDVVGTFYRSPLYTGWQMWMDELFTGFTHAWDAIANNLVLDTFTGPDGTSALTTRALPPPPAPVDVRTGLAANGDTLRPIDPEAAITDLDIKLREQGLELTAGSRNHLNHTLNSRLAKSPDSGVPVPVNIRRIVNRTDIPTTPVEPPSIAAVIHIGVAKRKGAPEVGYVGGQSEFNETRSWTVSTTTSGTRGTVTTAGVGGWGALVPNSGPTNPDADGNRSQDASPAVLSTLAMPHDTTLGSSDTTAAATADATKRTITLFAPGPFARLGADSGLTLTLEIVGDGLAPRAELSRQVRTEGITATGDGGRVQTLYPAAYLQFGPGTPGPGTPELQSGGSESSPRSGRNPATVTPEPGAATPEAALTRWKHPAAGNDPAPDAHNEGDLVLPVAVEDGGRAILDLAHTVLASARGWQPGAGAVAEGRYTGAGIAAARGHAVRELGLNPRSDAVGQELAASVLPSHFISANTSGGIGFGDISRTSWAMAVRPDYTSARVLYVAPTGSITDTASQNTTTTTTSDHSGGVSTSGGVAPVADTTAGGSGEPPSAANYASGDANRTSQSGGSHGETVAPKRPYRLHGVHEGPLYLVEFDSDWAIAAKHTPGAASRLVGRGGTSDPHLGWTRAKVTAWVSQDVAMRLGILDGGRTQAAAGLIDDVAVKQQALADAESDYLKARRDLWWAAHEAKGQPAGSDAFRAYQRLDTTVERRGADYNQAFTDWLTAQNTAVAALADEAAPAAGIPGGTDDAPGGDRGRFGRGGEGSGAGGGREGARDLDGHGGGRGSRSGGSGATGDGFGGRGGRGSRGTGSQDFDVAPPMRTESVDVPTVSSDAAQRRAPVDADARTVHPVDADDRGPAGIEADGGHRVPERQAPAQPSSSRTTSPPEPATSAEDLPGSPPQAQPAAPGQSLGDLFGSALNPAATPQAPRTQEREAAEATGADARSGNETEAAARPIETEEFSDGYDPAAPVLESARSDDPGDPWDRNRPAAPDLSALAGREAKEPETSGAIADRYRNQLDDLGISPAEYARPWVFMAGSDAPEQPPMDPYGDLDWDPAANLNFDHLPTLEELEHPGLFGADPDQNRPDSDEDLPDADPAQNHPGDPDVTFDGLDDLPGGSYEEYGGSDRGVALLGPGSLGNSDVTFGYDPADFDAGHVDLGAWGGPSAEAGADVPMGEDVPVSEDDTMTGGVHDGGPPPDAADTAEPTPDQPAGALHSSAPAAGPGPGSAPAESDARAALPAQHDPRPRRPRRVPARVPVVELAQVQRATGLVRARTLDFDQYRVLMALRDGLSPRGIIQRIGLTRYWVDEHINGLPAHLGLDGIEQAIELARDPGFPPSPPPPPAGDLPEDRRKYAEDHFNELSDHQHNAFMGLVRVGRIGGRIADQNTRIAAESGVPLKRVGSDISEALNFLRLRDRAQAITFARETGLVSDSARAGSDGRAALPARHNPQPRAPRHTPVPVGELTPYQRANGHVRVRTLDFDQYQVLIGLRDGLQPVRIALRTRLSGYWVDQQIKGLPGHLGLDDVPQAIELARDPGFPSPPQAPPAGELPDEQRDYARDHFKELSVPQKAAFLALGRIGQIGEPTVDQNKRIAEEIGRSPKGASNHISEALNRLRLRNRDQAITFARATGLVPAPAPAFDGAEALRRVRDLSAYERLLLSLLRERWNPSKIGEYLHGIGHPSKPGKDAVNAHLREIVGKLEDVHSRAEAITVADAAGLTVASAEEEYRATLRAPALDIEYADALRRVGRLTPHQRLLLAVMSMIKRGLIDAKSGVGFPPGVSASTVRAQSGVIYSRLGVNTRADAVRVAEAAGLTLESARDADFWATDRASAPTLDRAEALRRVGRLTHRQREVLAVMSMMERGLIDAESGVGFSPGVSASTVHGNSTGIYHRLRLHVHSRADAARVADAAGLTLDLVRDAGFWATYRAPDGDAPLTLADALGRVGRLTPHQRLLLAVMSMMERGLIDAESGVGLPPGVSASTVRAQSGVIYSRLDVRSRADAVRVAEAAGLTLESARDADFWATLRAPDGNAALEQGDTLSGRRDAPQEGESGPLPTVGEDLYGDSGDEGGTGHRAGGPAHPLTLPGDSRGEDGDSSDSDFDSEDGSLSDADDMDVDSSDSDGDDDGDLYDYSGDDEGGPGPRRGPDDDGPPGSAAGGGPGGGSSAAGRRTGPAGDGSGRGGADSGRHGGNTGGSGNRNRHGFPPVGRGGTEADAASSGPDRQALVQPSLAPPPVPESTGTIADDLPLPSAGPQPHPGLSFAELFSDALNPATASQAPRAREEDRAEAKGAESRPDGEITATPPAETDDIPDGLYDDLPAEERRGSTGPSVPYPPAVPDFGSLADPKAGKEQPRSVEDFVADLTYRYRLDDIGHHSAEDAQTQVFMAGEHRRHRRRHGHGAEAGPSEQYADTYDDAAATPYTQYPAGTQVSQYSTAPQYSQDSTTAQYSQDSTTAQYSQDSAGTHGASALTYYQQPAASTEETAQASYPAYSDATDQGTADTTPGQWQHDAGSHTRAEPVRWHESYNGIGDLIASGQTGIAQRQAFGEGGGEGELTELVRFGDGTLAVRKVTENTEITGDPAADPEDIAGELASARQRADAEQLASLVGRAIGADVPGVYRVGPSELYMHYMSGGSGATLGDQLGPVLTGTVSGIRLGLLDILIGNSDRNPGNVLYTDQGTVVGIDHGGGWTLVDDEPYDPNDPPDLSGTLHTTAMETFYDFENNQWIANPLTGSDVRRLERAITALRSQFVRLGRQDWYDGMLMRFYMLRGYASGTADLLGGGR